MQRLAYLNSVFRGGVVPRKGVVIVVEAFADGAKDDSHVLRRTDVLIVRTVTNHVGGGVNKPSHVLKRVHAIEIGCQKLQSPN